MSIGSCSFAWRFTQVTLLKEWSVEDWVDGGVVVWRREVTVSQWRRRREV
jgi:hypothetical protein